MFDSTITLFNFHEGSGKWYLSTISGVDFGSTKSSSASKQGVINADAVELLVPCLQDKSITTGNGGLKSYAEPKEYAACADPEKRITFRPERDFIYDGVWNDLDPIVDGDYESGLYHELNDDHDGIFLIASAAFYSLLPHFEIGGR